MERHVFVAVSSRPAAIAVQIWFVCCHASVTSLSFWSCLSENASFKWKPDLCPLKHDRVVSRTRKWETLKVIEIPEDLNFRKFTLVTALGVFLYETLTELYCFPNSLQIGNTRHKTKEHISLRKHDRLWTTANVVPMTDEVTCKWIRRKVTPIQLRIGSNHLLKKTMIAARGRDISHHRDRTANNKYAKVETKHRKPHFFCLAVGGSVLLKLIRFILQGSRHLRRYLVDNFELKQKVAWCKVVRTPYSHQELERSVYGKRKRKDGSRLFHADVQNQTGMWHEWLRGHQWLGTRCFRTEMRWQIFISMQKSVTFLRRCFLPKWDSFLVEYRAELGRITRSLWYLQNLDVFLKIRAPLIMWNGDICLQPYR